MFATNLIKSCVLNNKIKMAEIKVFSFKKVFSLISYIYFNQDSKMNIIYILFTYFDIKDVVSLIFWVGVKMRLKKVITFYICCDKDIILFVFQSNKLTKKIKNTLIPTSKNFFSCVINLKLFKHFVHLAMSHYYWS